MASLFPPLDSASKSFATFFPFFSPHTVIRDSIDGVFILEKRCKAIIDTLFPEMSVLVANEYELIVRRVVKYMLPAKYVPSVQYHKPMRSY